MDLLTTQSANKQAIKLPSRPSDKFEKEGYEHYGHAAPQESRVGIDTPGVGNEAKIEFLQVKRSLEIDCQSSITIFEV